MSSLDGAIHMKHETHYKTMTEQEQYPRFVVCLAAYNGMAFVVEQIKSILQQKYVCIQLVISVDQSTDGTESYLAQWAIGEPRIILLPCGQRFGSAAPNFFRLLLDVNLQGFNYLSFADQDDIWHPEKLFRAHILLSTQSAQGYSSNFTAFWATGKKRFVNKATPQKSLDYLFEGPGPGCTFVLHISLALKLQEMVRNAGHALSHVEHHDWMIYAFSRAHGFMWVIDKWSSMLYRQHSQNQVGVNSGWRAFSFRVSEVLSGRGFRQSLLIAYLIQKSELRLVRFGLSNGRIGYLWLAFQAHQCRRRFIDQIFFFVACLLLAIIKPKINNYP